MQLRNLQISKVIMFTLWGGEENLPAFYLICCEREVHIMKEKLKAIYNFILDIFTLHLPSVCFAVVFVTYIMMIVYRYIFHRSLSDIYELNTIVYLWCVILGATYATRKNLHIRFGILYDRVGPKTQLVMRIIGNAIVFVLFIVLLPSAWKALKTQGLRLTSILSVSFAIVYLPFIFLIIFTIVEYAILIIKDLKLAIEMIRGKETL